MNLIKKERKKSLQTIFLSNIENVLLNGVQLILNPVFKSIRFDRIEDDILKHLVISRICQPRSKVATVDYLKSHFDELIDIAHLKISSVLILIGLFAIKKGCSFDK